MTICSETIPHQWPQRLSRLAPEGFILEIGYIPCVVHPKWPCYSPCGKWLEGKRDFLMESDADDVWKCYFVHHVDIFLNRRGLQQQGKTTFILLPTTTNNIVLCTSVWLLYVMIYWNRHQYWSYLGTILTMVVMVSMKYLVETDANCNGEPLWWCRRSGLNRVAYCISSSISIVMWFVFVMSCPR